MIATERPTRPDDCPAWPRCGREVQGVCDCEAGTPTAVLPPPDRVAAYAQALRAAWRAQQIAAAHADGLTDAERAEGRRRARG